MPAIFEKEALLPGGWRDNVRMVKKLVEGGRRYLRERIAERYRSVMRDLARD